MVGWKNPVQRREVARPASYFSSTTSPSITSSSSSSESTCKALWAPMETRPSHSRRERGASEMRERLEVGRAGREVRRGTRMGERVWEVRVGWWRVAEMEVGKEMGVGMPGEKGVSGWWEGEGGGNGPEEET